MLKGQKLAKIEEVKEMLKTWISDTDKENNYMMRFHRCYLDGSYGDVNNSPDGGYKLYKLYVNKFSKNLKESTWTKEAISTFKNFLIIEFFNRDVTLSNKEVENILVESLGDHKEAFINMLVDNCKDLLN
ncbi:hypothetical protein [Clostridium sp.]|uniref:hypothetical protein n=1 Tax=Clostridium sp. TaxID=1506 RepID=UPI003F314F52